MAESAMMILLLVSTWFDIRTKKIPNLLIIVGLFSVIAYTGYSGGFSKIIYAVAMCILTIALCFPLFRLHGIGAGDIKLLALIAALHGMERLLYVSFVMFTCAGIYILWKLWHTGLIWRRLQYFVWYFCFGRYMGEVYFDPERDEDGIQVILAPFATIGYFIICIERWWTQ